MKVERLRNTQDYITARAIEESATKLIAEGSVILVTRSGILAHSLPVATTDVPLTINQDLKALTPFDGLDPAYLTWAIRSEAQRILRECSKDGTTVHSIETSRLHRFEIPIAPAREQTRIVEKLDRLFSHLDQAARSLKTAQEQLTVHHQAILHAAFRDVPDCEKLPSVLAENMSNGYSGKPVKYKTDVRVLSLTATTSGVFSDQHYKYLDEHGLTQKNIWCQPNDILVQRGNTSDYVGVPAIYTGPPNAFIYPDLMIRLRADEGVIDPKYLYYALSSPRIRNYLRTRAKGSAGSMPKISQAILASVDVPYCDPSDQTVIVGGIERRLSYSLSLEKEVAESRAKLSRMRLSILKRAFSGKLVPQDPADAPASALLKRIAAERKASSNGRKERKTGT